MLRERIANEPTNENSYPALQHIALVFFSFYHFTIIYIEVSFAFS